MTPRKGLEKFPRENCFQKWRLGQIPKFSIQCTFYSYPARFNSISIFDIDFINSRFIFRAKLAKGKKTLLALWHGYDTEMSILLEMCTSDCENNARFGFHPPKNPHDQLGWQLNAKYWECIVKWIILSCSTWNKWGTTLSYQYGFWFWGCTVEPVHFGTIQ